MLLDVGQSFARTRTDIPFPWLLKRTACVIGLICLLYFIVHLIGPLYLTQVVQTKLNPLVSGAIPGEIGAHNLELLELDLDSDNCEFRGLTTKKVFSGDLRVAQDDRKLLGFVRKCVFTPPSPLQYNLVDPTGDPSSEQGVRQYVIGLLGNKRNGVYIDCGANDGEDISNTLVLERDFGWSGLLIEADPNMAKKLLRKRRKAWVANVCAGIQPYPYEVEMYRHKEWTVTSRLAAGGYSYGGPDWTKFQVKCLPLYTMMSALGLTDLDYMSMDIEGVELKVLETLPFDKINVKVFSIETMPGTWDDVRSFMNSKGYDFVKTFRGKFVEDDVFAQKSLLNDTKQDGFVDATTTA